MVYKMLSYDSSRKLRLSHVSKSALWDWDSMSSLGRASEEPELGRPVLRKRRGLQGRHMSEKR